MLHKNSVIAALETTVKQHADRINTVTGTHAREIQDMRSAHDAEKKVLVDSVAEKQEQISTQQLRISDLEAENVSLREKIKAVFSMMQGCMDIATDGPAAKAGAAIDQAFKKVGAFGQTLEAACVAAKEEVSEAVQSVHNYSKAEEAKPKAKAAPKATSPFAESQGKPKATEPGFTESGIRTSASPQKRHVPGARRRVQMKRSAFVSQFDQSQQFRPKDRDAFERLHAMGFSNATLGQVAKAMRQNNDDLNRVIEQFIV